MLDPSDSFPWTVLADQLHDGLLAAEAELVLEQAVHGLDTRDEVALQALLAERLASHHEVAREVPYPSIPPALRAGPRTSRAHRQRCDLVLSKRGLPLRPEASQLDLFAAGAHCDPGDALWLEVKVAYQFRAPGVRHRGYGAQFRQAVVADLRKMAADPLIRQAALLLLVFNESEDILHKDLDLFESVLAEKDVLCGFRQVRSVPILDRIGHRLCTLALWPTLKRPPASPSW